MKLLIGFVVTAFWLLAYMPEVVAKEWVVAIDAGHGGRDRGAVGKNGTQEKKITLAVAKKLEKQLQKIPNIKPVLLREDDYYLSLRERIEMARRKSAKLFISIHADAYQEDEQNNSAKGASVFILSKEGASSEAVRWLAKQESREELLGNISLDDKNDSVAAVLLDLSQKATQEESERIASFMLTSIGRVAELHGNKVQKGDFAVLKSPDIPSVLIETEFISNELSEKRIMTEAYQQTLAYAIAQGVQAYITYAMGHNTTEDLSGIPLPL